MQIPLKHTFSNPDGTPALKTGAIAEADGSNVLTMRDVCVVALTMEFKEDQENPGNIVQDKLKRFEAYQLFQDTTKDDEFLDIDSDLASYLKPRVARCFAVIVAGPALKLLDGKVPGKPKVTPVAQELAIATTPKNA